MSKLQAGDLSALDESIAKGSKIRGKDVFAGAMALNKEGMSPEIEKAVTDKLGEMGEIDPSIVDGNSKTFDAEEFTKIRVQEHHVGLSVFDLVQIYNIDKEAKQESGVVTSPNLTDEQEKIFMAILYGSAYFKTRTIKSPAMHGANKVHPENNITFMIPQDNLISTISILAKDIGTKQYLAAKKSEQSSTNVDQPGSEGLGIGIMETMISNIFYDMRIASQWVGDDVAFGRSINTMFPGMQTVKEELFTSDNVLFRWQQYVKLSPAKQNLLTRMYREFNNSVDYVTQIWGYSLEDF